MSERGCPRLHRRAVCIATGALIRGKNGPYRGALDWCPDCGAIRSVTADKSQMTEWLLPHSTEVDVLYSKFKQRQRAAAEVLDA